MFETKIITLRPSGVTGVTANGAAYADQGCRIVEAGSVRNSAFCRWELNNQTFTLENDRYGLFPAFYAIQDDKLILSTDISELLAIGVPADLDYDALSAFIRVCFHIGDSTPFTHIKRLPPSARVFHRRGIFRIEGEYPHPKSYYSHSRNLAIDDYISLFHESIRRILCKVDAFQLPLSGGRDSRHILLETLHQGRKPSVAITARFLPPRDDNDIEVVRQLLDGMNISHEVVAPDVRLCEAVRRHIRLTQYMSMEHVWSVALADALGSKQLPVLDGLAGDILSAALYQELAQQHLLSTRSFTEWAHRFLNKWQTGLGLPEAAIAALLSKKLQTELHRDRAIAHIENEFRLFQDYTNPLQTFLFFNRTRNGPGLYSLGILRHCQVYFPFIDTELFDFLSSLPPEFIADHRFHDLAIAQAYPGFQSIKYSCHRDKATLPRYITTQFYLQFLMSFMATPTADLLNTAKLIKLSLGEILRNAPPQAVWWRPFLLQLLFSIK